MKLKPFKEILKMSKEAINEALAPIRAKKAQSKAELEKAKIDEQLITLEADVHELCSSEDLNFDSILNKLDKIALLERRKKQFDKIIADLFPEEE